MDSHIRFENRPPPRRPGHASSTPPLQAFSRNWKSTVFRLGNRTPARAAGIVDAAPAIP